MSFNDALHTAGATFMTFPHSQQTQISTYHLPSVILINHQWTALYMTIHKETNAPSLQISLS